MIDERSDENAEDDRQRPPELRGKDKGEQLGFVADFGEGNDARLYQ